MTATYLIGAILIAGIGLVLTKQLRLLQKGNARVTTEIRNTRYDKISDIGVTNRLSVLPLVDYFTDDNHLKTEAGVSYLIKTDAATILMDVGLNKSGAHPSPMLHNMQALGISASDIDALFISHLHLDHVGGLAEQKNSEFSLSRGNVPLKEIPAYTPVPMSPSRWNPGPCVIVNTTPTVLYPGIADIGVIPRNLFLMGYTLEHSLAVNVAQKGIVLIIGCGHQTIEKIIQRAKELFDEPIYGIIGGLHFPVKSGRIMFGPVNIQKLVGSDRPPWRGLNEKDVDRAIDAIKQINPAFIALSPHDSCDWSLDRFRTAFGDKYHDLKVGKELII
ncbi:MAG: MBL fold metallo-hydrolase [Thermodesulfobacteriota bacterium]|nr:MBL fold metallo-hydrolase [Thermodesulfobacteriota bacterium]